MAAQSESDAHRSEYVGTAKRSVLRASDESGEQAFDGVTIDTIKFRRAMNFRENRQIARDPETMILETVGLTWINELEWRRLSLHAFGLGDHACGHHQMGHFNRAGNFPACRNRTWNILWAAAV